MSALHIPAVSAPGVAALPRWRLGGRRLILTGAATIFVGITLFQRLGYVLDATQEVPLCLLTGFLGIGLFMLSGRLRIDGVRLWLFGLALGALITTLFIDPHPFSSFSLVYVLVLYLPFACSLTVSDAEYLDVLKVFQNCLLLPAAIAIAQFVMTETGHQFPRLIEQLPAAFVLTGYNTHPPIEWGSSIIRANGELFLEPSFLSQFMAFGILIELIWLRRLWRLGLYVLALVASLSGTGLILLGVFGTALLVQRRRYLPLALLILAGILCIQFVHNSVLDALLGRVDEYEVQNSSAFMRFIGPLMAIGQALGNSFPTWLAGLGPGTAKDVQVLGVGFNPFVAAKLLIEYGLIGTIPFLVFVTYCFFAGTFSGILKTATWFAYMLLSGSLQQPHTVLLFLMLTVLFRPERPSAATPGLFHQPPLRE